MLNKTRNVLQNLHSCSYKQYKSFSKLKSWSISVIFYPTGKCTTRIGLKIANSREQNQDRQFVSLL